ncbi:hypothetical protein FRC03_008197, partial [Tulasnella sp. 419]
MSDWETRNKTDTGIGSTICRVTPEFGTLTVQCLSNLGAFRLERDQMSEVYGRLADLLWYPLLGVLDSSDQGQTSWAGNGLALMVNSEATTHFPHLDGETKNELYPILLGQAFKGLDIEWLGFQATYYRLALQGTGTPPPDECYRDVPIQMRYRAVGWE